MKAKINAALAPLVVPLKSLHLDPKNARKHNPKNLTRIKRSLRVYGQQKPIVTSPCSCSKLKGKHEQVTAGNGTVEMAKQLGWTEIARVPIDDPAKAKAFGIADNRSAEGAGWNKAMLDELLAELDAVDGFDPADVGFDDAAEMPDAGGEDVVTQTFSVIADFDNEEEQAALLEELEGRGLK